MSTKRRDNKGRVLLNGEIQEESGRYRYRYIDILGKRREIFRWIMKSKRFVDVLFRIVENQRLRK